jgi:U3 small nucleolar RNA-associated protein 25
VRNIVFYGLPDHAEFYKEMVTLPFLDEGVEPEEVTVRVLWSKLDAMRLERIVGTKEAGTMCAAS